MKKRKLRKWVKYALVILISLLIIIMTINAHNKINECMNNGYSENYCKAQFGLNWD